MQLKVNGEYREFTNIFTIAQLLDSLGIQARTVAVEVNGEVIPKRLHHEHSLRHGDVIEIVHPVGGG